jgi:flavin-dependent dehydrogenase
MREKFDYLLVSNACKAGVTLEEGVEVRHIEVDRDRVLVRTSLDIFSTSILVGADGANSIVVQSLGMKKGFEYGLGINSHIAVNRDKLLEWDGLIGLDLGIPGGYAWIFPKQDCLSIGAGGSFRVANKLKPCVMHLIQAYDLGTIDVHLIQGHLMPLRKATTPLSHERVLLVGDAAGLIDPLTGEGIYYALKSSYLAATTIMRFIKGEIADLEEYENAINNELMPELKAARTIQKINSAAPRLFSHFLNENDRFWRAFCRLLRGEKTYVDIKNFLSPPLRLVFRYF